MYRFSKNLAKETTTSKTTGLTNVSNRFIGICQHSAGDLQPIFSALVAVSRGGSIEEQVWRSRFGYLDELSKFGLSYSREGNKVRIFKSDIHPACASATDLRGGASAVLLALAADGESEISSGELILRGYDSFVEKLKNIGADISYQ